MIVLLSRLGLGLGLAFVLALLSALGLAVVLGLGLVYNLRHRPHAILETPNEPDNVRVRVHLNLPMEEPRSCNIVKIRGRARIWFKRRIWGRRRLGGYG